MFKSRKLSMLLCNLALFPVGDLLKRCNLNYQKLNKKHFKRARSVVVTYIFISLELIKVKVPTAPNSLISRRPHELSSSGVGNGETF